MKEFASELEDFPDLLRIVAQHKRLPDTIVEKDYYVVRALRELAGKIGDQFIFKGGTSLSKGWNLLKRFSEDIDVLFRVQDGTGGRLGRGKLDRRLKYAERILHEAPGFRLKGTPNSQRGVHRTSEFEYPKTSTSVASVSNVIKLESGTRGGINPCEDRQITSYISDFAIEKGYTDLANDLSAFGMPCLHITR